MKKLMSLLLLTGACTDDPNQSRSIQSQEPHSPSIIESGPYAIAYHLKAQYKAIKKAKQLISLDSIARTADGELSEALGEIAKSVYEMDKKNFFQVVYSEHLHHLANAFVLGMSAELAVLQERERQGQLVTLKREAQKSYNLLPKEVAAMADSLMAEINPSLFD